MYVTEITPVSPAATVPEETSIVKSALLLAALHVNGPPPELKTPKGSVFELAMAISPKSSSVVETSAIGYVGSSSIIISSI